MQYPNSFIIKKGDTGRPLDATLKGSDNVVQVLTDCTVQFRMRPKGKTGVSARKVDAPATIVTPASGAVRYSWVAADVDTPGIYEGEFVVTLPSTKEITFPAGAAPFIEIVILGDV